MKSFDILTSDQELEVHTATYGPEIDQSQHVKSVTHIRNNRYITNYTVPWNAKHEQKFIIC